jgi:predicted nucleotidyltransferase
MNKDDVINKLRAHERELKAAGVVRLAVFGSVARGDNSPESDVDLLADFDRAKRHTLLGAHGEFPHERDNSALGTILSLLGSRQDRLNVEIVLSSFAFSNSPDFIDDGIPLHVLFSH